MIKFIILLSFFIFSTEKGADAHSDVSSGSVEIALSMETNGLLNVFNNNLDESIKAKSDYLYLTCYSWSGCGSSGHRVGLSSSTYSYIKSQCDANGGTIGTCPPEE